MNNRRSTLAAALLAASVAVVGPIGSAHAADAAAFKAAYAEADAARKAAAKMMYEWRDTKKMLKKAKKLADKGEFDKAVKLANAAREQGEMAQAQAKREDTGWQAAVIK